MDIQKVIDKSKELQSAFDDILQKASPFEIKAILNSEILFFISIIQELGIKHIIESGRARGQSTELITRFAMLKDIKFDSIEYDYLSEDVSICAERLYPIKDHVQLHFGDANKIAPSLLQEEKPTALIIDGPKGAEGALLAVELMDKHPNIKAAFLHDIHRASQPLRQILEDNFCDLIASDQKEFVEAFSFLDTPCWEEHQKYPQTKDWGPYQRGPRKMPSYGPTLICLYFKTRHTDMKSIIQTLLTTKKQEFEKAHVVRKILRSFIPDKWKSSDWYMKSRKLLLRRN